MGSTHKTGTEKVAAENLEEKRLDKKQKRDAATKSTKIVWACVRPSDRPRADTMAPHLTPV